jgi:hypothetical protein
MKSRRNLMSDRPPNDQPVVRDFGRGVRDFGRGLGPAVITATLLTLFFALLLSFGTPNFTSGIKAVNPASTELLRDGSKAQPPA